MSEISDLPRFVELDRRFAKLEREEESETSAFRSYTTSAIPSLFGIQSGMGWPELLENRLVVVLGEPGSGKTWEFRERAKLLEAAGSVAFYIQLDQLVNGSLPAIFDSAKTELFESWRHSAEPGFFFLDSADEAKFHKLADFYTSLDKFAAAVGRDRLIRATTLISCRVSEWQPQTDAAEVIQRLRPEPRMFFRESKRAKNYQPRTISGRSKIGSTVASAESKSDTVSPLLVVQIQPLDLRRVQTFVQELGIAESAAFVEALDRSYAWEFVRRPVDVVDLVNFWRDRHRLGSLSEIIEHDVGVKLSASKRDLTDPLSPEKALNGAEALAASTSFCRQFNFKVPDDSFVTTQAMDARSILPAAWRVDEIKALLARPIFDSASYGRIRFHHRRVAEYLTAQWLAHRVRLGCPVDELNELLFDQFTNERVLRPSLAAVAAWLCCGSASWNNDVRDWTLETSPSIHLQFGDPECLPIDYRRRLLEHLVQRGHGRERQWIESSTDALGRLAADELTPDISAIILNETLSQDLRSVAIQIARHGDLKGCLNSILQVIERAEESGTLKIYAAAAIRDIGDDSSRKRLAEIAHAMETIPNRLCGIYCEAIYPRVITADQLCSLLKKTEPVAQNSFGFQHELKNHFSRTLDEADAAALLKCLVRLATAQPHIAAASGLRISQQFSWLGEVLPTVLLALLRRPTLRHDECELAKDALALIGEFQQHSSLVDDDVAKLNQATFEQPAIRQLSFWRMVAEFREKFHSEPRRPWQVFDYYEVLRPDSRDFVWFVADICDRDNDADRYLALQSAIEYAGADWKKWWNIWRAVRSERSLRRRFTRVVLVRKLAGPLRLLLRIRHSLGERWWWHRQYIRVGNSLQWLRSQWLLLTHVRWLASGKPFVWLGQLAIEAHTQNNRCWAPDNWDQLKQKRGRLIAWATRTGCKRAWRYFWPPLPHEEEPPNRTDYRVIVGLSGLQASVNEGLDFQTLPANEATRAARYGVNELNGFASWFPLLAVTRAEEVQAVLCECATGEWKFGPERANAHEVLNKLLWQGEYLDSLITDCIWQLFQAGDPPNKTVFESAIRLLVRLQQNSRGALRELAERRVRSSGSETAFMTWIVVLLQLDATRALDILEAKLTSASDSSEIVVRLCAILASRRLNEIPVLPDPSYLKPEQLKRFIPFVYRYVRPQDDIQHEGSYTPTARDEAQLFRGSLIDSVSKSLDPQADAVLRDLLHEPSLKMYGDWIEHLLAERRMRAAEIEPWAPSDVRLFEQEHEIEPKTDRDLFAIARKRLRDIKHDVEKAENSLRTDLRENDPETQLRTWLQRQLRERSRNRYVVPQEEEIDLRQRPDLRLHNPNTPPVGIEVKWADNWPVAELLERLENQLIGQYLRDHNAQYGVYVLGRIKLHRQFWEDPTTGAELTFEQVLEMINDRARSLVLRNTHVRDIFVLDIDFRMPSPASNAKPLVR